MSKYPQLRDDEIGCITCSRWRTGSIRCDWCIKFSAWKGVERVNQELIAKGLTPYSCAEEMRIFNLYGAKEWLRYRAKKAKEHEKE